MSRRCGATSKRTGEQCKMNKCKQGSVRCHCHRPYIFVTYGPTGSGKSTGVDQAIRYLGFKRVISKKHRFLIDDLVETSEMYKQYVKQIIKEKCNKEVKLCSNLEASLTHPDANIKQKFNDAYQTARKTGCTSSPENNGSCDALLDERMKECITSGCDLIFESVGHYFMDWFFTVYESSLRVYDYQIIFVYNSAPVVTLLNRNKTRALEDTRRFINDQNKKTVHAPRLPNIDVKEYTKTVRSVVKVFNTIVDIKLQDKGLPDMRVLVFDNSMNLEHDAPRECIIDVNSKILRKQKFNARSLKQIKSRFKLAWFPRSRSRSS